MSKGKDVPTETNQHMSDWIRNQLSSTDEKDICNAIYALQKLLRKDEFRVMFATREALQR